jgi:hypothetical protein
VNHMNNNHIRIWIWLQDAEIHKAVYNQLEKTLIVTNDRNEIILKRSGITSEQLTQLEALFLRVGAKRIDGHQEPFTYL